MLAASLLPDTHPTCNIGCMLCYFCLRELTLEEAARKPLLTGRRVYLVDPSELYPHVYDSLAKAKLTSAFIANSKVGVWLRA